MEKRKSLKPLFFFFLFSFFSLHFVLAKPVDKKKILSLKDCIALGLKDKPGLKAARENLKAYLAEKGMALSYYFPDLEMDSNYFRGNFFQVEGPLSEIFPGIFTVYDTQFSANYVFEDFGERYAMVGKAEAKVEQASAEFQKKRLAAIFHISKAYFNLLKAQTVLKLRRDDLRAAQKNLLRAGVLVRTGQRSRIVLSEAEVACDTAQYNLLRAKHQIVDAENHLNQEMGLPNSSHYQIKNETHLFSIHFSLVKALALAFRLNPDLLAQKAKVKESQAEIAEAAAKKWPVLSGSASYGWVDEVFPPKFSTWTFGISLNWPFFNGGRLNEEISAAKALKKRAEDKENALILRIENRIEQNYMAVRDAHAELKASKIEYKASEENYRLAVERYKFGLASSVNLAFARANLSLAAVHRAQAQSDLRISEAAVYYSIGLP